MKLVKKQNQEVDVVADIICNMCGGSLIGEIGNFNGLVEASILGGFDSTHLADDVTYTFSICEKCLCEHIFSKFIIPEEVS